MTDIFQGSVAPDVKTTTSTATTAPQYFQDYLSGLAGAGTTAMGKTGSELISPLTEMQNKGYAAVPTAATAYQTGLTNAETTAGKAAAGMTPESIQSFMNPYTHNVVDEMSRLQQQNIQRNVMPQLQAGFVGSGGLGSQRYANALGQTTADMQSNLLGSQTGALQKGYGEALQAAYNNANLMNTAAKTQADLAEQEQKLGLTGAGALTKAGAEQQAYNQSIIDAPLKTATNAAALMKGYQVPVTTTETFTGPKAGVYGNSPLSQIAALGSLIGSGVSGTTNASGTTTPGWLKTLWDSASKWYSDTYPSSTTTDTTGGGQSNVNTDLAGDQQENPDMAP